jgi:putative membrane protein
MRSFVIRLGITALGLWAADAVVAGFRIDGASNVVIAALLLGIVNALVRPLLVLLTLPLTLVTLGAFLLVVNGISLAIVAWLVPGVASAGLWPAVLAALIVSVVSWFASAFVRGDARARDPRRVEVTGRRLD